MSRQTLRGNVVVVPPLYPRLLRLKHLHPSAWQRAVLVEGAVAVGAVAALADQVSAWTPLVLPVAVAVVVKFHDVLTGVLRGPGATQVADVAAVDAPAVALPHVVVLRPGQSAQREPVEPATADLDIDVELGVELDMDIDDDSYVVWAVEVEEADEVPVPVPISPIAASGLHVRADLDALTAAALERALAELSRRGGLDPFVMSLDADGIAAVDPDDAVSLPGQPGLRAVVVCSDVALPGRADAVRMELEHAHGEPELVTVVYRHTGEGPEVVPCERTRTSGKRSGVRRRFFAKQA